MNKEIPPYTESEYPGFFLIEGFSRYAANEDGRILDLKTNKIIPVYKDKKGYNYVSVVNDEGERVLYQRYRLMMIAMSDRPDNYRELVVNHINNLHDDDVLELMEWTTTLGNNRHAIEIGAFPKRGFSPKTPILIYCVETGKELLFPSKEATARFLKISSRQLKRLLENDQVFFRGDYLIKYQSDKRPWRAVEVGEKAHSETGNIILVRNYLTKEVTEWPSYRQYARSIRVSTDTIVWRLRNNNQRLFPEMCQYKLKGDPTPWREPTEQELLELKTYGHVFGILVKDLLTDEVVRYNSQREMSKALNISEPTVTLWLSKPDQIQGERYLVQRDCVNPVWRKIDNLQETLIKESKGKRYVEVTLSNGEKKTYPAAKLAADAMGLKPTAVNHRLKSNGQKVFADGTRWKYL